MMCAWSEPHLETDRVGLPAPTRREAMMFLGATLLACGLAPVSRTLAARSDETAFAAVTVDGVLKALDAEPVPASQVALSVPDSVENGAVVPVEVTSHLPVPQEIFVVSAANPFPLVVRFFIPTGPSRSFQRVSKWRRAATSMRWCNPAAASTLRSRPRR